MADILSFDPNRVPKASRNVDAPPKGELVSDVRFKHTTIEQTVGEFLEIVLDMADYDAVQIGTFLDDTVRLGRLKVLARQLMDDLGVPYTADLAKEFELLQKNVPRVRKKYMALYESLQEFRRMRSVSSIPAANDNMTPNKSADAMKSVAETLGNLELALLRFYAKNE